MRRWLKLVSFLALLQEDKWRTRSWCRELILIVTSVIFIHQTRTPGNSYWRGSKQTWESQDSEIWYWRRWRNTKIKSPTTMFIPLEEYLACVYLCPTLFMTVILSWQAGEDTAVGTYFPSSRFQQPRAWAWTRRPGDILAQKSSPLCQQETLFTSEGSMNDPATWKHHSARLRMHAGNLYDQAYW